MIIGYQHSGLNTSGPVSTPCVLPIFTGISFPLARGIRLDPAPIGKLHFGYAVLKVKSNAPSQSNNHDVATSYSRLYLRTQCHPRKPPTLYPSDHIDSTEHGCQAIATGLHEPQGEGSKLHYRSSCLAEARAGLNGDNKADLAIT
jgi:hypothetical protein